MTKTLSASETAYALHRKLGAIRAWPDFLTDCIRPDRDTAILGLSLTPCGRMHNGRTLAPRYALADIAKFIEDMLAVQAAGPRVCPVELDIDPAIHWRLRRYDKDGNPVSIAHSSVH